MKEPLKEASPMVASPRRSPGAEQVAARITCDAFSRSNTLHGWGHPGQGEGHSRRVRQARNDPDGLSMPPWVSAQRRTGAMRPSPTPATYSLARELGSLKRLL